MFVEYLELWLFVAVCIAILAGFPVAFTLAGVALVFALIGDLLGEFQFRQLNFLPQRIFGIMSNEVLIAAPLFIFMGLVLEKSKVAEDLLNSMAGLFRGMRGGLALSVVMVGMMMAASTGIVGATVVTMGLIALPVMLRNGYDPRLATGTICASGTLGQVIPPSIVLVFLGDVLTYANQQANLKMGKFAGKSVGVGDLFAGSLIPGLMLVILYAVYIIALAAMRPERAPVRVSDNEGAELDRREKLQLLVNGLLAPSALIIAVLGSILGGIATPTEAAGVGAVGAILLAALRARPDLSTWLLGGLVAAIALMVLNQFFHLLLMRETFTPGETAAMWASFALLGVVVLAVLLSCYILLQSGTMRYAMEEAGRVTAMIFAILVGASLFSLTFRGLGGEETVHHMLDSLPGGLTGAMIFVMALMFVMGFFLDFLEIIFILVPIVGPALIVMGADPVWLGVMIAVNLQTSFLTPPFGFALFFLRGVAPPEVKTRHIYQGVIPFILLQLLGLVLIACFPALATWLPEYLFSQ
ncbi:TRAP transporter large permease [Seohaeicola zhoushanensis]|uniref:C4-dicarboxylate ABC transporter n=1 Tax=Seohaeicola zhoushanensis TaxID=1569283 RepID=A0A8J3GVU1_9RHOB|nr:TRAP transporter large permease subunit [Seohaeicola zhoushanensis]GHF45658.1 C4-dicarboxylate ABC transporter [Seohaeicola zhoushanensis]